MPATERPRVSVVIPVHDGAAYLGEALASVTAQSAPAAEVVVVDDGSMDDSAAVVARSGAGARYVYQRQAGTAAARNRGIAAATGDLLAFLDQDDTWMPDKLALQVAALGADPGLHLVFGGVALGARPAGSATIVERGVLPSTLLARRSAFERVGLFDPRWMIGEWADWYARAVDGGLRIGVVPTVVAFRRLHSANKGRLRRSHRGEYARLLKDSLDRRRTRAAVPAAVGRGA
jgi:glycosyltransferase involved in cell wall biosynthesis